MRTLEIRGIQDFENKSKYLGNKACFEIGHLAYMGSRLSLSPTFFLPLPHRRKCFYMGSMWGHFVGVTNTPRLLIYIKLWSNLVFFQ